MKIKFLSTLCTCWLIFTANNRVFSQTIMVPGDMAVLGFNSDQSAFLDGDVYQDAQWAVVALRRLEIGTVVHFTDAGITQVAAFNSNANNEGHLTWTVTTVVPAGKIFAMDCVDGSNFADLNGTTAGTGGLSDYGTVSGHLGGIATGASIPFSTTGDQIIIYQALQPAVLLEQPLFMVIIHNKIVCLPPMANGKQVM